jgi:hypothetical protein
VVKVFKNPNGILTTSPTPYDPAYNFGTTSAVAASIVKFSPYGATFKGGASVEVADMGTVVGAATKSLNTTLDNKLELIVANESGMRSTVYVYGFSPALTAATTTATPYRVRTYLPFSSTFRGGMSLAVAPVVHAGQDLIPDIIVGAGNGGGSQVQILNGAATSTVILKGFQAFTAGDTTSFNVPVKVAAFDQDNDANGIAEFVLVSQGTDGVAGKIRKFSTLNAGLVDQLMESGFDPAPGVDDFLGAYFTATLKRKKN